MVTPPDNARCSATVFIVDDDPDYRRLLELAVSARQLRVQTFGSPDEFLQQYDPRAPGVLVMDMRMPGMSGIEVQELLLAQGIRIPTIVMTAYAEVAMSVRAMKAGAVDYVQKPDDPDELCDLIQQAVCDDCEFRRRMDPIAEINNQLRSLSPVERQVLKRLVDGISDTEISRELGIQPAAVDDHRRCALKKMDVASVLSLVRQIYWTSLSNQVDLN